MLTLTVPAIRDLQVCERYYDYKYQQQEYAPVIGRELLAERFQNTLKRVVSSFFYRKQGGVIPSYNALVNRWERLWFPKNMDAYDLVIQQQESAHGNYASYSNIAVANLMQFYDDFAKDPAEVMLLDEKYVLPLDNNIRLEGSIDLVLRYKGAFKVIRWSTKVKRPVLGSLNFDFAADKLAYDYRNKSKPGSLVRYYLYDLASSRPGFVEVEDPAVNCEALLFWARHARDNKVFVPRRGYTTYCRGCPYDDICRTWKFPSTTSEYGHETM